MGLLSRFTSGARRVHVVPAHAPSSAWSRYVFSTDHKTIGIQFLVTGAFMALVGGLLALLMRSQIAWPGARVPLVGETLFPGTGGSVPPDVYAALFTMHGTIMTFFVIIPLLTGAFGNYLIPLMIGAPDMAFPRLNALSYWLLWPGILCMFAAFGAPGGGPGAGWTSYAPLSTVAALAPGSLDGQTWWLLGVTFAGLSSITGSINYLVTVTKMRAPGMTLGRLPLTVWGLCIAASLQLMALPVLTSGAFLQAMDRAFDTAFFTPSNGEGEPLLWQHLFWFYSHPAVYVMVLPAMGLVSDVMSAHARKAIFGYRVMVASLLSIAVLGFVVWGHHMFTSGMDPRLEVGFLASTVLIALPSGVKVFNWIGTLWGARIRLTAAMQCAIGFVALFVIGGLSGLWLASTPNDGYLHDTYTVVAHFHYIVVGGTLLAMFGAVYHWFPKMFGRRMSETLGTVHFVGTFVLLNCVFLPMHQLGFAGMIRRTADPYVLPGMDALQPLNAFVTWSAVLLGIWQVFFVANVVYGLVAGRAAGRDPWHAAGLEWEAPSPPPAGNFLRPLIVERGPYEYTRAQEGESDVVPQARPAPGPSRRARGGPRMSTTTSALGRSVDVDARSDAGAGAPDLRPDRSRVGLQRALLLLCAVAVPLTLARSWQLVWQPLLPIPLLLLSTRAVARVQVVAVLGLLLLGGAVTTYRVGMAVPDWPGTFYQNMWTYPLADMLEQGYGVTLEHTHRLWASAVGLIAICQLFVAYIHRERRAVLAVSGLALLAIIGQGLLGGTRVLENSQHLAFLHGALAQLVFAAVVVVAIVTSRAWAAAPRSVTALAAPLRRTALLASAVVYTQIVLGAATRHSGHHAPLAAHITLALGALVVVTMLIGRLGAVHREVHDAGADQPVLRRLRLWTTASLHTQILLGILVTAGIFMWSGGFEATVSVGEAVFASLHVAVGAVLLASCVAAALWSWRLLVPTPPAQVTP